jgi:hypothetical protein
MVGIYTLHSFHAHGVSVFWKPNSSKTYHMLKVTVFKEHVHIVSALWKTKDVYI